MPVMADESLEYEVEAGPDTKVSGIKNLPEAVRTAKRLASNAALGADAKVFEVRDGKRHLVDKYGLVKGRVRRIELAQTTRSN